ncbi:DUF6443 domain-containing protein [Flavobacterium tructae]|uniref:DUF6443 domain-containing protein n=1 Tax=Flavobacterium tructae TaxID=1114873 RepID=UPI0035A8FA72
MKKLNILIFILFPIFLLGQTQTENYVKTITYKKPSTSTTINLSSPSDTKITVNYHDGFNRLVQKVENQKSSTGRDVVTLMGYDAYGREEKEYLPYVPTDAASLNYKNNAYSGTEAFYNTTKYENTTNPYSQQEYESSPLNKISRKAAPGNDWKMNNGHETKFEYQTNTNADQVRNFKVSFISGDRENPKLESENTYTTAQLFKTITKNENWQANQVDINNNTVQEFTNNDGRLILKRTFGTVGTGTSSERYDTYYVYDDFGNLTFVIPPKAADLIGNSNGSTEANATSTSIITSTSPPIHLTATNSIRLLPGFNAQAGSTFSASIVLSIQSILDDLCYQYRYDSLDRLIEKKLPGKQWEYMIYDKLDRLIATGPTKSPFNNLTSTGWLITKYDVFNRTILTGWIEGTINSNARKTLQDNQNNLVGSSNETKIDTAVNTIIPSGTGVPFRYTNLVWPISDYHVLTVNYYDDYNFPDAPTIPTTVADGTQDVYYNNSIKPKGLPTGSWIRILESSTAYRNEQTYFLYDSKARVIRNYTKNFLGGYLYVDSYIDSFSGRLENTITTHKRLAEDANEFKTAEIYTYTDQDKLLTKAHFIYGMQVPQLLASYTYDELGQLTSKKIGDDIQNINYTYNVRGWLTGINDINSLTKANDPKDLFAFKINYNNLSSGIAGVSPQYNGSISETLWSSVSDGASTTRAYAYQYDNVDRLKNAIYQKKINNSVTTDTYTEKLIYDKNGNILTLMRNGNSDSAIQQIDNLVYTYKNGNNSNQLSRVSDNAPISYKGSGFIDGTNSDDDYSYDTYGNMTVDKNKGIVNGSSDAIIYNHLNLPIKIIFASKGNITYIYNALGQKVQKEVTHISPVNTTTTQYLGGYQYENGILKFFPTAEGYVEPSGSSYRYVYQYKDHVGNIRLSYTKNNTTRTLDILDENHFYPFGLKQTGYGSPIVNSNYKYNYNGKEFQDELGLNMYDFQARNYDPSLGRWMNIDPASEYLYEFSPYTYAFNDPINFVDNDGEFPGPTGAAIGLLADYIGQVGSNYFFGDNTKFNFYDSMTTNINGWSLGFSAATGFATGGIDSLKNVLTSGVGKPIFQKMINHGIDILVNTIGTVAADYLNNRNKEEGKDKYDFWKSLTGGLISASLEKVIPAKYVDKLEQKLFKNMKVNANKIAKIKEKLPNLTRNRTIQKWTNKLNQATEKYNNYRNAWSGVKVVNDSYKKLGANALSNAGLFLINTATKTSTVEVNNLSSGEILQEN